MDEDEMAHRIASSRLRHAGDADDMMDGGASMPGGGSRGGKSGGTAARGARGGGHRRGGEGSDEMDKKKERTSWTRVEDEVIVLGVAELGHKWYEIARRLPGRTDHAIRNRWSRLQSIMSVSASMHPADTTAGVAPGIAHLPAAAATLTASSSLIGPPGGSVAQTDLPDAAAAAAANDANDAQFALADAIVAAVSPMAATAAPAGMAAEAATHLSHFAAPSDESPFVRPGGLHLCATASVSVATAAPSVAMPH